MDPAISGPVRIRNVERDDLPQMYQMQLDPEANRFAVTVPRSAEAFDAHWADILRDQRITAKAILLGGVLAGSVSCFQRDSRAIVGYWITREHWGKGDRHPVSVAAAPLLEVATRPLHAIVATSNGASLRVLQKCGFVVRASAGVARQ